MTVAQTLPLVLFVVLFELAVGGAIVMWSIDRAGEAPLGFLRLTAVVDVAAASFGALIAGSLPASADAAARVGLVVAVLLAAYFLATFFPSRQLRLIVGAVAILAGLALLVAASLARTSAVFGPYDVRVLAALPLGALAIGGADGAMLLGHWYLVTPKLSPGPLQRASLVFFVGVALQAVSAGLVIAGGALGPAWDVSAIAVAIRLAIGIAVPLVIALGAWWTARMNTQSSTGLLYVALGMVLAGELSARMLFYVSGVPL